MLASLTIVTILAAAAASGLIGSFALMRRMTLAADSMSHVALPGLAIAGLFHVNPLIGGLVALLLGAVLIWGIEQRTGIATETVIGVLFSVSLAVGALLSTPEELLDLLFGNFHLLTNVEVIIGLIASLAIIIVMLALKERLTLSILSPEIAQTVGLNNRGLSLLYLIFFAINLILGLKFLGILLMGSLIIIPAAAAKNWSWNLRSDLLLSVIISVVSVSVGLLISYTKQYELGPAIISVAAGLFALSLILRRKQNL